MMPSGKVLNRLSYFVGEPVELGFDPALEAGKVGVALGE
jgi:hypothetical protein